ncbi:UNVERIFIED_CONTAM: hypothetical protein K2H54_037252 [Gekko kuhli]
MPQGDTREHSHLPLQHDTTMAAKGHFEPFDATTDDWDTNVSQFEFYITAQEITDAAVKKATFLSDDDDGGDRICIDNG